MNGVLERANRNETGSSESTADVWKHALLDHDGKRFVSWAAAESSFEELFAAADLPTGTTALHLFAVARQAEWLLEREGYVVIVVPPEWHQLETRPQPPFRKSALSE